MRIILNVVAKHTPMIEERHIFVSDLIWKAAVFDVACVLELFVLIMLEGQVVIQPVSMHNDCHWLSSWRMLSLSW